MFEGLDLGTDQPAAPVEFGGADDAQLACGQLDLSVAPGPGDETEGRDDLPALLVGDEEEVPSAGGWMMEEEVAGQRADVRPVNRRVKRGDPLDVLLIGGGAEGQVVAQWFVVRSLVRIQHCVSPVSIAAPEGQVYLNPVGLQAAEDTGLVCAIAGSPASPYDIFSPLLPIIVVLAVLSSLLPALRAAHLEVTEALRYEVLDDARTYAARTTIHIDG
jgi:hypothetical protein